MINNRHMPQLRLMAGLSLVELMIALLLGVILTLGVTQVYLGTSQTYRLTDGIAHVQETIRFATSMIQRDVRSAGGLSCLPPSSVDEDGNPDPLLLDVKLQGDRAVSLGHGINGWEAKNTGVGDSLNLSISKATSWGDWEQGAGGKALPAELAQASANLITSSDVLIVNSVTTLPVEVEGYSTGNLDVDDSTGIPQGALILSITAGCTGGELFQKANSPNGQSIPMAGSGFTPGNKPSSGFQMEYEDGSRVAQFATKAYYVAEGASGEPALFSRELGVGAAGQELVEGVEAMQVVYGLGGNYLTADEISAQNWPEVTSVRIAFVVRSGDNANSENITRTFNLVGTEATSPADRRARIVSSTTIGLRNRMP
ncbi:type IV pilus assembly protein PilW [Marinobacter segnicrescens]|uniref:Type IV pilus assembly protein PilW n=1 Tax=Marinobacter segnicrescens TaxID=430453 RepID=A0A1I0GR76_9GAMM|nr:PilW family protein [Marinobacter segnicrescens]SET73539.1 type IV pilus assembly protein PilW [Marinobacter segnicrescens]